MFYKQLKIKVKNYRLNIALFKVEKIEGNIKEVFTPFQEKRFRQMLIKICDNRYTTLKKIAFKMSLNEVIYWLLVLGKGDPRVKEYCDRFGIKD